MDGRAILRRQLQWDGKGKDEHWLIWSDFVFGIRTRTVIHAWQAGWSPLHAKRLTIQGAADLAAKQAATAANPTESAF